jgi:hypothetical protein
MSSLGDADQAGGDPTPRPVIPFMRAMLLLGALLVSLAGIQLFFLTRRTDHYFAWTISVPLTAAFLGAFYWTSTPLALFSGLERVWVRARVAVPGVLLFLWATLATTLLHLGKFHFHSTDRFAQGAAWLWLIIYAADPPLVLIAFWLQLRSPGVDPPRRDPLPVWYRAAVAAQAVVMLAVGVALFAAPTWVGRWWPWPITPLTARAMASWLLGLGGVLATAVWENDWIRIRIATVAYAVLGVLQFVAAARYSGDLKGGPAEGIYLVFVGVVLVLGAFGLVRGELAARGPVSHKEPAPPPAGSARG